MSKLIKNPNGSYFKIRRTVLIVTGIVLLAVIYLIEKTLVANISLPDAIKWFSLVNLTILVCGTLIVVIYYLTVLIHDVSFERIAKLGTKLYRDFKK